MKVSTRMIGLFLALVLLFSAIPMTAYAKTEIIQGVAFVDASSLRLRKDKSTSSEIVDTADRNEVVVVLSKDGDWYKVIYNLKLGYMHSDYLDLLDRENVELGYGKINGTNVNLRSGPGTSTNVVAKGNTNDKAYIIGVNNGWYKVIFGEKICYIRSDYLDLTEIPYENKASTREPLFFKGGKSTGTEVSADALNGSAPAETPSAPEPPTVPEAPTAPETPTAPEATTAPEAPTTPETPTAPETPTTPETPTVPASSDGIKYGAGFTTGSNLRLRAESNTRSKILASAAKGEAVVVLGREGDWYKVIYNLKEGYMHGDYLRVNTVENVELGYGKVNANSVNLRSGAGTSHSVAATASQGSKVYIVGINEGWYKVIFGDVIGYIRSDYVDLTEIPYENRASSKSPLFFRGGKSTGKEVSPEALNGSTGSTPKPTPGETASGNQIVETAKKYLGVPYVWGGTTPSGFDCSGFVYYVLRSCGISASRTLATMYKQGAQVDKAQLQPGDVVFFQNTYKSGISHVGIYVGDGQFIHSPHSGEVVSFANLYSDYYVNHYYGAVRFA